MRSILLAQASQRSPRIDFRTALIDSGSSYSDVTYKTLSGNGWAELQAEYGAALPDGSNIVLGMVEADQGGGTYFPEAPSGKTVVYSTSGGDPGAGNYSSHANTVIDILLGSQSPVAASDNIVAYNSLTWRGSTTFGQLEHSTDQPRTDNADVVNHSYVVNSDSSIEEKLRRMDYLVTQYDEVHVTGRDNTDIMPLMFAQGYNNIGVGSSDGDHGDEDSTRDVVGRQVTHLVSPETRGQNSTSWATPDVARCAALLKAKGKIDISDLAKPVSIKSILMTGATKETAFSWSTSGDSQPLNPTYGAGELNIYNSWKVQEAGNGSVGPLGWRYGSAPADYPFYHLGNEFAATLVWNRTVEFDTTTAPPFWLDPTSTHHVLTLELWSSNSNGDKLVKLMESNSTIDNVQHLYDSDGLAEGYYALAVTGASQPYGLSWRN